MRILRQATGVVVVFLLLAALLFVAGCGSDQVTQVPENEAIQTATNATSVEVTRITVSPSTTLRTGSEPLDVTKGDSVIRGERNRYKLHATEGEHLKVSISALEDNAVFQVLGPDNKALPGTEEGQDARSWEGTIPATGYYVIEVAGTRGNSTFSLSVTIS